MKEFLKGIVFYFINHVLNKIPSRKIRMYFYCLLSNGKISKQATIGLGVKVLDIRNVEIGKNSNVNFDSILDGRGEGIKIGCNVDIAPQVNIWSLEHEANNPQHISRSGKVIIEDDCWLANRVTVLPGSHIKKQATVGANSLISGEYEGNSIIYGEKARVKKKTPPIEKKRLHKIRVFR